MCLIFFLLVFEAEKEVLLCGAAGAGAGRGPGLGFRFPMNLGIPRPHRVTWSRPINVHPVKSPRVPKFERKPAPFVPIELL